MVNFRNVDYSELAIVNKSIDRTLCLLLTQKSKQTFRLEHKMLKKTGNQKTMKEAQIIQWPNEKRCKTNNDSQNTMQKD